MSKLHPLFITTKERHMEYLSHLKVLIDYVTAVIIEAENIKDIVDEHHRKVSTYSRIGLSLGILGSLAAFAAAPLTAGTSLIPLGVGSMAVGATVGVGAKAYGFHQAEDRFHEVMKLVEDVERECTNAQGGYYHLQNNFEQVGDTVMGVLSTTGVLPTASSKSTFEQRAALGLALTRHLVYNHKNVFKRINMIPVVEYPHFDIIGTRELYTSLFQTMKSFQKLLNGDQLQEVSSIITHIVQELRKLCANMKEHHESMKIE